MKRWIIAIAGVAVLGIVGAVAGWVTLRSIDWSEYEDEIVAVVRDVTGRQLTLRDGFEVDVGLTLELTPGGLRFENADWGSRPEMLTLEYLALRVRLWPLLFGRVELSRIELRGLDVLLETNGEGRPNWAFGEPSAKPPDDAAAAAPEALEELANIEQGVDRSVEDSGLPVSMVIRSAVIEDAIVAYHDGKTDETLELVIDRFEAEARSASAPLHVELAARYQGEPLELEGTLEGVAELLAGGPLAARLELEAGGAALALEGTVEHPLEQSGIDLALRAEGESLATLSGLAGSPLPDLGPYAVELRLRGGGAEFQATGLSLTLGSTAVTGDVGAAVAWRMR
ncbi:MAG: AsmA family protein [Proteobacteria bacterium]|nr:AsmA family protein [Pseudomonadota bacterium]